MKLFGSLRVLLAAGAAIGASSQATGGAPVGSGNVTTPRDLPADLNGSNFTYRYPISLYTFESQLQELQMAFLDVPPAPQNASLAQAQAQAQDGATDEPPVAVLLHGKNFCSITWNTTIEALTNNGYRVVAPDQVGFCKSTKPRDYQFSLSQLAYNTRSLLRELNITRATVIGHSLGGMLATRFALQHPSLVENLVLVNPIGLEDYIAKGVQWPTIEATYQQERSQDYATIRAYQQEVYYLGDWRPEYDVWARMSAAIYGGSEAEVFARNQARVVDAVLTQPVAHEFERVTARAVLMIGQRDTTAVGRPSAPPEARGALGRFDLLGEEVAGRIPGGELIAFPDSGHSPQVDDPENFHEALLEWLARGGFQGDDDEDSER